MKKTALVIPNDEEDELDDEEGDEDESRFFSGFLTWMMVSGFGGRGRFPSNSARAGKRIQCS